jgi:hypothetical protein
MLNLDSAIERSVLSAKGLVAKGRWFESSLIALALSSSVGRAVVYNYPLLAGFFCINFSSAILPDPLVFPA